MLGKLTTASIFMLLCGCGGGSPRTIFTPSGGTSGSSTPIGGSQTGGAGGGQTATGSNVLDVVVDSGPQGIGYINGIFASVTICTPGTTTCQTIDHMLVDTGSVGVRVLESLVAVPLPDATGTSGQALAECFPFVDGTAWGPLKTADVQLGSESASGLTIHVIGEGAYAMPNDCTGAPITNFEQLAANGILGVGIYLQDCGPACALSALSASNPGLYYACVGAACSVASVPLVQQVSHPVASFPADNNGVIIQLPSVAASGAVSVPGQMLFGIGTQVNNALGGATVIDLDRYGYFGTAFPVGGSAYTSILDSGSNGLFFLDSATTNLKQCTGGLSSFYCPTATTNLSATLLGASGIGANVDFSVANASRLSNSAFVFSDLAGPMPGFPTDPTIPAFDWGLPFFFGRSVYTAIENQDTPAGVGPYLAFF